MFKAMIGIRSKNKPVQYLRLTKEVRFDDLSYGRWTTVVEGMKGFILDEEEIFHLLGTCWEKKDRMVEELMDACNRGLTYALVGGYPCALSAGEYELLESPPHHCIGQLF